MVFCFYFEEGKIYNLSLRLSANSQDISHAYIDLVNDIDFLRYNYDPVSYVVTDGSYDIPVSTDKQQLADLFITAISKKWLGSGRVPSIPTSSWRCAANLKP